MAKLVYIMRGLPGSGKSTKAQFILKVARDFGLSAVICSADEFRIENGLYVFRDSRYPHDACLSKFNNEIRKGTDVIIVDNTNCTNRSMKPYVSQAIQMGYAVSFFSIQPIDINTLMARGLHNVPRESYERMLRQWVPYPTVEEILGNGSCNSEKRC